MYVWLTIAACWIPFQANQLYIELDLSIFQLGHVYDLMESFLGEFRLANFIRYNKWVRQRNLYAYHKQKLCSIHRNERQLNNPETLLLLCSLWTATWIYQQQQHKYEEVPTRHDDKWI